MALKSTAAALIEGPITDAGQLLLALVINELAGPDGWAYYTQGDLAKTARLGCRKTLRRYIAAMVKAGYLEGCRKPRQGLRIAEKALLKGGAPCPTRKCFCLFT